MIRLLTAALCSVVLVGLTGACLPQGGIPLHLTPSAESPDQSSNGWAMVGQLPRPLESHQTVVLNDSL
ncbi:MAG: hypothetical protein AAFU53_17330, partial [Cyanobacteria bacterium J06632_3]